MVRSSAYDPASEQFRTDLRAFAMRAGIGTLCALALFMNHPRTAVAAPVFQDVATACVKAVGNNGPEPLELREAVLNAGLSPVELRNAEAFEAISPRYEPILLGFDGFSLGDFYDGSVVALSAFVENPETIANKLEYLIETVQTDRAQEPGSLLKGFDSFRPLDADQRPRTYWWINAEKSKGLRARGGLIRRNCAVFGLNDSEQFSLMNHLEREFGLQFTPQEIAHFTVFQSQVEPTLLSTLRAHVAQLIGLKPQNTSGQSPKKPFGNFLFLRPEGNAFKSEKQNKWLFVAVQL